MSQCNCENSHCEHGGGDPSGAKWKPCANQADKTCRVMYIGEVCMECYLRMDPQYRLERK